MGSICMTKVLLLNAGLAFHRLYTACREQFLVSSELTLRAHLTEFKDHELLNWRRGLDGQDCVYIPLPLDALTKLLEDPQ
jgi:origin recognition complex subunit 2